MKGEYKFNEILDLDIHWTAWKVRTTKGDSVVNLIYMEDGDEFMCYEPVGKKYIAAGGGCIPMDNDINGIILSAAIDAIIRSITGLKNWTVDIIATNDV